MNLQFCKMTCLERKIQRNASKSNQTPGGKLSHLVRTKFNFILASRDHVITTLDVLFEMSFQCLNTHHLLYIKILLFLITKVLKNNWEEVTLCQVTAYNLETFKNFFSRIF